MSENIMAVTVEEKDSRGYPVATFQAQLIIHIQGWYYHGFDSLLALNDV